MMDKEILRNVVNSIIKIDVGNDMEVANILNSPVASNLVETSLPSEAEEMKMFIQFNISPSVFTAQQKFAVLIERVIKELIDNDQDDDLDKILSYAKSKNIRDEDRSIIEANRNKFDFTPLLRAAYRGSSRCLSVLLNNGANTQALTCRNDIFNEVNALVLAAQNGHSKCVKILLRHGMSPDSADKESRTALWVASYEGHYSCAELLLKKGADPNIRDTYEKWSPLHWAEANGDQQLHDLLFKHGATYDQLRSHRTPVLAVNGVPSIISLPPASLGTIQRQLLKARMGEKAKDAEKKKDEVERAGPDASSKELQRGVSAERQFFDIKKASEQTLWLKKRFTADRRRERLKRPDIIKVTGVPPRKLITADAASVKESIDEAGGEKNLTTQAAIQRHLPWPRGGNNLTYNTQALKLEGTRVAYQHTPTPGHLGGMFMFDVGEKNGTYDGIIKLINSLTSESPEKEKKLAKYMLDYAKSGRLVSSPELAKQGMVANEKQYHCFTRICYLSVVKEIVRRFNPGLQSNGAKTELFPFAVTHYRALELVAHGDLRMAEVFSSDAPYGLATGKKITSSQEGREKAREKVGRINRLYNERILLRTHPQAQHIVSQYPYSYITPRTERLHRELVKVCGTDGGTEDAIYLSDDESEMKSKHGPAVSSSSSSSSSAPAPKKARNRY